MIHQEPDGPGAGRHEQHRVHKADVVAHQHSRALGGNVFVALRAKAIHQARQQPGHKAQQVFGHHQEDIARHHRVEQADDEEQLADGETRAQQSAGQQSAGDHEQRVQDVVGGDHPSAMGGLAAQLNQRVHGHAVDAGKQRQQRQIGQHPPVRRLGQKGPHAKHLRRGQAPAGEVQIDRKHRHANGAQRHQANLHMAAAEHLTQQGTRANADRKHHQQQRSHLFVATQHVVRKGGEVAQEHRAKKPHPADAQQRAKHHNVAVRELEVAPGFGERVPVDGQARVGGGRHWHGLRAHTAQQRQGDAGGGHIHRANQGHGDQQATRHIAQQDGDKSAHLHHAIATRDFTLVQMLRQISELDRSKQRALQPHEKNAGQQQWHVLLPKPPAGQQHDHNFHRLQQADQQLLGVFVGQLATGG